MLIQEGVIRLAEGLETGLLGLLHRAGLAPDVDGQPGWPFAVRFASETLLIDLGLARKLSLFLSMVLLALLLLAACAIWRRARLPLFAAALVLFLAAPWPDFSLLVAQAYPTSFHRSPARFDAASIRSGVALYQKNCADCHGQDGQGEGPRAPDPPMWPPRISAELLARRIEGEVFWHIRAGMHDRHGIATMPGFADQLDPAQVWSILDALRALAAGASVREEAAWAAPVRAPEVEVRCPGLGIQPLSRLRGQRVRIVASPSMIALPREDPRLVTIALVPAHEAPSGGATCVIEGEEAYDAYALLAGTDPQRFAGTQLIIDRAGWLRARAAPGSKGWSRDDLLCRSANARLSAGPRPDGLGDLIAAMDADPVRVGRLGATH
jgi:mono/diheme cytochrome c family protein